MKRNYVSSYFYYKDLIWFLQSVSRHFQHFQKQHFQKCCRASLSPFLNMVVSAAVIVAVTVVVDVATVLIIVIVVAAAVMQSWY